MNDHGAPAAGDPARIVITATLDGEEVLCCDGMEAKLQLLLIGDRQRLVAALAQALHVVTSTLPEPSELIAALDAVETFAALRDPPDAAVALSFVGAAIVDCRDAFTAAHAASTPA